jgi:hypothetical protein
VQRARIPTDRACATRRFEAARLEVSRTIGSSSGSTVVNQAIATIPLPLPSRDPRNLILIPYRTTGGTGLNDTFKPFGRIQRDRILARLPDSVPFYERVVVVRSSAARPSRRPANDQGAEKAGHGLPILWRALGSRVSLEVRLLAQPGWGRRSRPSPDELPECIGLVRHDLPQSLGRERSNSSRGHAGPADTATKGNKVMRSVAAF